MSVKKWAVRILICVGAIYAAWVLVNMVMMIVVLNRFPAQMRQIDQEAGLNSPNFKIAQSIMQRAWKQKSLTDADMVTLGWLSNDPHWAVRCRALSAFFYIGNTPQAKKAASIARTKLNDPDKGVREFALEALAWLKAPDAQKVARRMLSDPSANVREQARKMIPQKSISIIDNSHPY